MNKDTAKFMYAFYMHQADVAVFAENPEIPDVAAFMPLLIENLENLADAPSTPVINDHSQINDAVPASPFSEDPNLDDLLTHRHRRM